LVAAAFKLFGIFTVPSFFFLVLLNILFSTAVCIPIFHAGKRVAGLGAAAAAAWLWALFLSAIMIPFEWIWDTSLSALLAATLLWATLELADSDRVRDWCGYGLLWGFTLMTNPSLENYDDKHSRFSSHITKDHETVRYFRMGETPLMDEAAQGHELHHLPSAYRADPSPTASRRFGPAFPLLCKFSDNRLLVGARHDALRRRFRNRSARRHRRARQTAQRLHVSACRLPGRVSFLVLHHAHFASLLAPHRPRRSFC
jgi:hypothetical protein